MSPARIACDDHQRGTTGAEIHRRQIVAHLAWLVSAVPGVPEAELADPVVTPALDRTILEERTGVVPTRRDRPRRTTDSQIHLPQSVAHLAWVVPDGLKVPETELARPVHPPALDRTILEERTGVNGT